MVAMQHLLSGSCYLIDFALTQVKTNDTISIIGLLHLISVSPPPPPPVEDFPFLLTPEDWLKLHSPVKTYFKYGLTQNFMKIKALPPKNSICLFFFILPLKKSPTFITYPWRIPWFLN